MSKYHVNVIGSRTEKNGTKHTTYQVYNNDKKTKITNEEVKALSESIFNKVPKDGSVFSVKAQGDKHKLDDKEVEGIATTGLSKTGWVTMKNFGEDVFRDRYT
jgi:hypothetical protein